MLSAILVLFCFFVCLFVFLLSLLCKMKTSNKNSKINKLQKRNIPIKKERNIRATDKNGMDFSYYILFIKGNTTKGTTSRRERQTVIKSPR